MVDDFANKTRQMKEAIESAQQQNQLEAMNLPKPVNPIGYLEQLIQLFRGATWDGDLGVEYLVDLGIAKS